MRLWRLDCGVFPAKHLVNGCYLIRHDETYMLWDAGFGAEIVGHPKDEGKRTWIEMSTTVAAQLAVLGLEPRNIAIVALSHDHFDHIGQADSFPDARLLVGEEDWESLVSAPATDTRRARVKPWLERRAAEGIAEDADIFGDGTVVMIATPGHTPGHHSLLVRLTQTGAVLLTGDLYDTAARYAADNAPSGGAARFKALVEDLKATVIIQHEPADVAKLPHFPASAR